jgi:hypothetical protein
MHIAWLKGVCSTDRVALAQPFVIERNGLAFTVATDGRRMVELPGMDDEASFPDKDIRDSIHRILAPTPPGAVDFSYPALCSFLNDALKDAILTCDRCDNEGYITEIHRGRPCGEPCPKCDAAVCRPKKVYIAGTLFNAKLFKPFIDNLPQVATALWHQEGKTTQAVIDAGIDWRLIMMPMREDFPEQNVGAPRFEIEGAEAKAA